MAWRSCCAWIVVFALAFHGLIPVGYMPDFSRQAGQILPMTICSGFGPMQMDADQHHMDHARNTGHNDQQNHNKVPCLFSLNSVASFDGLTIPFIVAFIFVIISLLALPNFRILAQRAYGNASSRSPPLFA
jgi:hypothetical protein